MENKDKHEQGKKPAKEGRADSSPQQNGNVGHQQYGSQAGGQKTGANREEGSDPKGEDEHS